ncbi:TPA: LysR family transcriptional regulator [Burkholderia vietnamiensis]|uniref:LysR family transcriptional regulator n=1 Tax=Burkholderia vietnamiensis TaxID=60552 RepID=A0AAW7T0U1_BURVI|nr:LysR family transcriptional regulator [Burkholderia vietnamiensis]MDN7795150.1 LysR family transcriptional regulator [Burkholderia vietnamiensis]HDR9000908.1 LysR family transcriptional regulator [Burkholderia vietnamiensis]HDR9091018.1 LysR family transcriptional regulator [Burkholderia vietnamiensis]
MKLRQLDALRAVAEAGSLHEAARRLFLTQPAISRSIRELEVELGMQLLTRSANGARLTPFAHQVLKRALVVHREIGRIVEDAQSARGELGGQLTLAITPPASTRALVDALIELSAARQGVRLDVIEWRGENIADGLRNGTIDVAIFTRYGEPKNAAFEWLKLYELDVQLTIAASYQGSDTLSIEEIHALPWLLLDSPIDESSFVATLFGEHDMPLPERITRCSAMNLYLDLAMQMEAVAVFTSLATPLLSQCAAEGWLKLLNLSDPAPKAGMYLAYSSGDLLTATAKDFIRRLRAKLDGRKESRFPAGLPYNDTYIAAYKSRS